MSDDSPSNETPVGLPVEEGTPAWVVTFGDLMSLLLCFFVLLLSFSEMDKAKYKEVAGSLAKAFGVQRKIKAFQAPKGLKMISKDFDQALIPSRPHQEFIDTQQRKRAGRQLQREIQTRFTELRDSIQIVVEEHQVVIRLMGETTFDSGKADIKDRMVPLLHKIGKVLTDSNDEVIVAGHTDNVPVVGGPYGTNLKLSIARAATVAEFLLSHSGIDPGRLSTMGFGKHRPLETNETAVGRKRNRRVEIILRAAAPAKRGHPISRTARRNPAAAKASPGD
jgi:chemotaxis protein MotB